MIMKTEDGKIVDYTNIFRLVGDWFALEMKTLWRSGPVGNGLLMGCPLWGEKFIRLFDRYCLPSILARNNQQALAQWGTTLVIFTRDEDLNTLQSLKGPLRDKGIELLLFVVPREIMAEVPKDEMNRYWVLGPVHQLIMKMAGWWDMGFHMLLPDHVFGPQYFERLRELSKKYDAIVQTGLSANIAGATEEIDAYRQTDGSLVVPDRDLGSIALRHLHAQMQPMILNGKDLDSEMPTTTWLAWKGKDAVSIYSAHLNAAYFSPDICVRAQTRIPATLDAELPNFLNSGAYIPEADDGMTFIELSDDQKPDYPAHLTGEKFNLQCWTRLKWDRRYIPLMAARGAIPTHHQPDGMELGDIEEQQAGIMQRLVAGQPVAALQFVQKMMEM